MNDEAGGGVHWSFPAIGVVAPVWNVMGVMNYFVQMNPDALASFPETHRAIIEGRPAWATGGFAIAVLAVCLADFCFCAESRLRIICLSRRCLA
ncbi:MAG: hypothetical protein WBO37_13575 [Gammaproteobacteria bacterium]